MYVDEIKSVFGEMQPRHTYIYIIILLDLKTFRPGYSGSGWGAPLVLGVAVLVVMNDYCYYIYWHWQKRHS